MLKSAKQPENLVNQNVTFGRWKTHQQFSFTKDAIIIIIKWHNTTAYIVARQRALQKANSMITKCVNSARPSLPSKIGKPQDDNC